MKKNIVKLTESDLVKLIKKMISEQEHHEEGSEAFNHYILAMEEIFRETFMGDSDEVTDEDIDVALDNLAQVLDYADGDENVSDEEFEQLYEIHNEMAREIEIKFDSINNLNESIYDEDDDKDEEEKEIHPALARQLRHFDPDEFTLIGKIQVVKNKMAKTPNFVLRTRNKTEDGTRILAGIELLGYEDKIVKLTGRTKNGKPPSFQNPLKLTKRPQVLSR